MKIYLKSGSGIENPVDIDGNKIKVGDKLSWAYGDRGKDPEEWMLKPIYEVKFNNDEGFYFATGINKELYLHDFRFEFAKIMNG